MIAARALWCLLLVGCLLLSSLAWAGPMDRLRQALDADAAAWSQAVTETVAALKQTAPMTDMVVWALAKVMAVETLRPVGTTSAPPDQAKADQIRKLLAEADAYFVRGDRPPLPPPPPAPAQSSGNPALDALRRGPISESAKALIQLGIDVPAVTHSVVMVLLRAPYPELRPLAEHVLATHSGGDTEAMIINQVISGELRIAHPEAAGLLYLMRPDNFWNVQSSILRNRQWSGPRLLHLLPQMVLSSPEEALAREAAQALTALASLTVPGEGEWTAARRAALYRAWRDLPADQRPTLPPLIAPEWNANDPIVAALQRESAVPTGVDYARVLADVGGPAKARQGVLRALIFEDTNATWQTVLSHVERETDWTVLGYALSLAEVCLPARVESLRAALVQRLRLEGEAGGRQLALSLTEAQEKDAVLAIAKLGAEVGREQLCGIFQEIARGQTEPLSSQMRSFAALRNSITAYAELDREGAAVFYRSLLASEQPRQREVAVYGVGELRLAEAIPEVLAVLVPANENCFLAGSVCVALGKIGTPAAHEALAGLLTRPDVTDRMAWEVAVVMNCLCGLPSRSPGGTWQNGTWYTLSDLPAVTSALFAPAIAAYADRTTDERTARELRSRARVVGTRPAAPPPPPPAPAAGQPPPPPAPAPQPVPPRTEGATDPARHLRRLAEAVDADAAGWTAAVREAVAGLKQQQAASYLYSVAAAERVRPVGEGVALPDEAMRQQLREMLEGRSRPVGVPASEEPGQQRPTPEAIKALFDVLIANDTNPMTMVALKEFGGLVRYPESARVIEHFMTAPAAENRGMIVGPLAYGDAPYPYAEAACLLFLLQGDNGGYEQANILSHWRRWRKGGRQRDGQPAPQSPPRLAHILPVLLAIYNNELAAQAAATAMTEVWGLQVPGGPEWSLARRTALYRAWRDLPAERKATVPPLIAPEWDAANPVVAALRSEFERLQTLDHRVLAADRTATVAVRMASLRALMLASAEADWQVVADTTAAETDLKLMGEIVAMAAQIEPERATTLSAAAVARLRNAGADGVRQLAEAIFTAQARETVVVLGKLGGAADGETLCTLFEGIASGQRSPVFYQIRGFGELRNSISAYYAIAPERAAAFYRSLLRSGEPRVKEVGVYGCGELRVAEAVPELLSAVVPENENCLHAGGVCVTLGKIATPAALEALAGLLQRPGLSDSQKHSVMVVMRGVAGHRGIRGPEGTWENGTWYSVVADQAVAERFAAACEIAIPAMTGERGAGEARHVAEALRRGPQR